MRNLPLFSLQPVRKAWSGLSNFDLSTEFYFIHEFPCAIISKSSTHRGRSASCSFRFRREKRRTGRETVAKGTGESITKPPFPKSFISSCRSRRCQSSAAICALFRFGWVFLSARRKRSVLSEHQMSPITFISRITERSLGHSEVGCIDCVGRRRENLLETQCIPSIRVFLVAFAHVKATPLDDLFSFLYKFLSGVRASKRNPYSSTAECLRCVFDNASINAGRREASKAVQLPSRVHCLADGNL